MPTGVIPKYLDGNDSGWLELTDASIYTGAIRYRKIGDMVYVEASGLKLANELAAFDRIILNSIPSGYRPLTDVGISVKVLRWNWMALVMASGLIYPTGEIRIFTNSDALHPDGTASGGEDYLYFSCAYFWR